MPNALTDATSQISRALFYAQKMGWPVLPIFEIEDGCCAYSLGKKCSHPGQHPRTAHGVHDATSDPSIIRAWWGKWSNANIGVATGCKSGIVVIDVDPRNGSHETGKVLLEQLGRLPRSIKSRSGGGGTHYIFKYPDFTVHRDSNAKLLGPGFDLLSDGSYFIAPNSTHRSGKKYYWVEGQSPGEIEPAALLNAWLQRLRPPLAPEVRQVRGDGAAEIVEGQRNNQLTSSAASCGVLAFLLMLFSLHRFGQVGRLAKFLRTERQVAWPWRCM
jgi:hypothetical protein